MRMRTKTRKARCLMMGRRAVRIRFGIPRMRMFEVVFFVR